MFLPATCMKFCKHFFMIARLERDWKFWQFSYRLYFLLFVLVTSYSSPVIKLHYISITCFKCMHWISYYSSQSDGRRPSGKARFIILSEFASRTSSTRIAKRRWSYIFLPIVGCLATKQRVNQTATNLARLCTLVKLSKGRLLFLLLLKKSLF